MFRRKFKKGHLVAGILAGSLIGSIISLLLAPTSGRVLRKDIKENMGDVVDKAKEQSKKIMETAKTTSTDLVGKAADVFEKSRSYAAGVYTGSMESIIDEIDHLRNALTAAVEAYRSYTAEEEKPTEKINDEVFEDYENDTLPKHEGMKKRTT